MSTSALNSISRRTSAHQTPSNTDSCQAIVFTIAGHLLALPLPAVLRVLTNSALSNNNSDNHLVYVEQQPIPLVDLRPFLQPLNDSKAIALKAPQPFLLLAALHSTNPIAIPVDEAPNLMTLSHATMQALPQTYRQQIGNIASYVAVVEQQTQSLTILLLDLHPLTLANDIPTG